MVSGPVQRADVALVGGIAVEILRRREHAAEKERAVDRRDFRIECARAFVEIEEVIVEAADAGRIGRFALPARVEEAERGKRIRERGLPIDQAAFDRDRIDRERKTGRGDARGPALRILVAHETVRRIRLVEDIAERLSLKLAEVELGFDLHGSGCARGQATILRCGIDDRACDRLNSDASMVNRRVRQRISPV